jgi:hypothetical protein
MILPYNVADYAKEPQANGPVARPARVLLPSKNWTGNNAANSDGMIMIMLHPRSANLISSPPPALSWITLAAAALLLPPVAEAASSATVDSRTVRVAALPLRIAGKPVAITNGSIRFTGTLHTRGKNFIDAARGGMQARATTLAWPATQPPVISIHAWTANGHIHLWHDAIGNAHIAINNGHSVLKALQIKTQTFSNVEVKWGMLHHVLTVARVQAFWNGTKIVAHGTYNMSTGLGRLTLSMPKVYQQRLFAMLAPQRVNIIGLGQITAKVTFNATGRVTGTLDLTGVSGGFLCLHHIPLLRTVLAGTYGQPMAAAMADDLHDYPFTTEQVNVVLTRTGMTFKLNFIRGPGNPLHLKPRFVVIDGKKMVFRASDLKSVHLTIPVRHLTLMKLLALIHKFFGVKPSP